MVSRKKSGFNPFDQPPESPQPPPPPRFFSTRILPPTSTLAAEGSNWMWWLGAYVEDRWNDDLQSQYGVRRPKNQIGQQPPLGLVLETVEAMSALKAFDPDDYDCEDCEKHEFGKLIDRMFGLLTEAHKLGCVDVREWLHDRQQEFLRCQ